MFETRQNGSGLNTFAKRGRPRQKGKDGSKVPQRDFRDYRLKGLIPNIKFEDFVPYDQLHEYYDSHSFWLNLADNEGFGMQPLEAMARGEVVITALYPAIAEYLPLEANFWVRTYDTWDEPWIYLNIRHYVYDPHEFLEAMERAIATPVSVLQSYAEVNRRRAEEYEYHKVYARFREYF